MARIVRTEEDIIELRIPSTMMRDLNDVKWQEDVQQRLVKPRTASRSEIDAPGISGY